MVHDLVKFLPGVLGGLGKGSERKRTVSPFRRGGSIEHIYTYMYVSLYIPLD